jgi:hypothetical protein
LTVNIVVFHRRIPDFNAHGEYTLFDSEALPLLGLFCTSIAQNDKREKKKKGFVSRFHFYPPKDKKHDAEEFYNCISNSNSSLMGIS